MAVATSSKIGKNKGMSNITKLLDIMAKLRDKQNGCPWDVEQTYETIAPYTIEEAYEVADAIDRNDMPALKEELGDLLFQVVFHSQMAKEEKKFTFEEVVEAVCEKMVRRHPHVFSGGEKVKSAHEQVEKWEEHKAQEKKDRRKLAVDYESALEGLTLGLPALMRAEKMQKRAAKVGFDWTGAGQILAKIEEELNELKYELDAGSANNKAIEEELGDLLFACVNLARYLDIQSEEVLRQANRKFERRFRYMEKQILSQQKSLDEASLQEMDEWWDRAKILEREGML